MSNIKEIIKVWYSQYRIDMGLTEEHAVIAKDLLEWLAYKQIKEEIVEPPAYFGGPTVGDAIKDSTVLKDYID